MKRNCPECTMEINHVTSVEVTGAFSISSSRPAVLPVLRTLVSLLAMAALTTLVLDLGRQNQVGWFSTQLGGVSSSNALVLGRQTSGRKLAALVKSNKCKPGTCGNVTINYPFGLTPECARSPEFQLDCLDKSEPPSNISGLYNVQPGHWPYLKDSYASGSFTDNNSVVHNVTSFQILNVTSSTLIINSTSIKTVGCFTYNSTASIVLPSDGPYRISSNNLFFVSGCYSFGRYNISLESEEQTGFPNSGSCGPLYCVNQFYYPFCNTYDCCTSSLPEVSNITLQGGGIAYKSFPTCGFSSILLPSTYSIESSADFGVIGLGTYGVELAWALPVQTSTNCSSLETTESYACSPLANCTYVSNQDIAFNGYYCECIALGFHGDGYLNGTGCKDINECTNGSNECAVDDGAICKNTFGSYDCSCPHLKEGDGFKNGSGCTYINYCRKNLCAASAQCVSDFVGNYSCNCLGGLVGDGFKQGTGCRIPRNSHAALIAGASAGGILFLIFNCLVFWYIYKKRQNEYLHGEFRAANSSRKEFLEEIQRQAGANICRLFTLDELTKATDNFSNDRVLGIGGFGTVFEGTLDGLKMAIKRTNGDVRGARNDTKQFINEVTILSQVNHRNLVKLLGCCLETQVPVLIYEFISNGNLLEHLRPIPAVFPTIEGDFTDVSLRPALDWSKRLKIAIGAAKALTYLHSGTSPPIYHRDVKTANILLDDNYEAKVADFGLSKLVPLEVTHLSTAIQGTPGYLDPEYFETFQITDKSDVYSFGVVLLELITAEKPVDLSRQAKDHNLALRCGRLMQHGRLEDIIDPALGTSSDSKLLDVIHDVAKVAINCVERRRDDRPSMQEVLERLKVIARLEKKTGAGVLPMETKKPRPYKYVKLDDDDDEASLVSGMSASDSSEFLPRSWLTSDGSSASGTRKVSLSLPMRSLKFSR